MLSASTIPQINRTYKNIKRLRQILTVFGKHGFTQVIEMVGLSKFVPTPRKTHEDLSKTSIGERLCLAFEELGPTFVKLGQMFASRPDLISPDFSKAFARLRDDVRSVPFREIQELIDDELDDSIENLYATFEEVPLAAASIAQVHGATLPDGDDLVVKIQRPGITKLIETDLSILHMLAKLAQRYIPELRVYDPVGVVEEFDLMIRNATDFIQEAHNIEAIHENFAGNPDVVIPTIVWELTSKRVLTMERIHGIPLHDTERLKAEGYDLPKICQIGVQSFLSQIFIHGLFHADLHGGNIFVLPGNRLAFVDFGEVGRLGSHTQASIANIFAALLSRDFEALAREYMELGTPQAPIDILRFADDLEKLLSPLFGRGIREVDVGNILGKAASIAATHRIRLPRDLVLIGRVIITMEDLIRKLDPNFDLLEAGGTFATEIVKKKLQPERLAKDLLWNLRDFGELSKILPSQIKYVMQKLSTNDLSLQIDFQQISRAVKAVDIASKRLSSAIVIMGLLIASSILTFGRLESQGFPNLGLTGYIIAGLFGIWLLFSIVRSGKF